MGSSTELVLFHILDYVREYPLVVSIWLVAPIMVEMAFDSVAEVAEPGQAARQKVKRLLTINKAANLMSLSKLRL